MGSNGSLIPFFLNKKKEGFLPITDKRMTRFNISLENAVEFVLSCSKNMWGGEIFVPKIPSFRIIDAAKAISSKIKLKYIGIRPGEKIHEEMISQNDAINSIEFKNYYVIAPNSEFIWNKKKYLKFNKLGKSCNSEFTYNSHTNNKFLTIRELKKIIQKYIFDTSDNV